MTEGCPPECLGRPLEGVGNGVRRWMVASPARETAPDDKTRRTGCPILSPAVMRLRGAGVRVRRLAGMLIREAAAADWPGIWAVMEPTVRAGETYTFPVDSTGESMRAAWLPATPAASAHDAGTSPRMTRTYVVTEETGGESPPMIVATAQLHPNFPGAGSRIANASFMVHPDHEGKGYGRLLAHHVLDSARADGYRGMQFNAVVESNTGAVYLWESLGFDIMTTIPNAFDHPVLGPVGLHIMFKALTG